MSSAVKVLTEEVLNADGSPKLKGAELNLALYRWCALHCVFRDDGDAKRSPGSTASYPQAESRSKNVVVRQAYADGDDDVRVVLAGLTGNFATTASLKNVKGTVPVDSDIVQDADNASAARIPVGRSGTLKIKNGATIMVSLNADTTMEFNVSGVRTQGGKQTSAPTAPSYLIVGRAERAVDKDSTEVLVTAYIRGAHFMSEPVQVTVPLSGGDVFYSMDDMNHRGHIAKAVNRAYQNLVGLHGDIPKDATVDFKNDFNGFTVAGVDRAHIDEVHATFVGPAKATGPGQAYFNAVKSPSVHSYALMDPAEVGEVFAHISANISRERLGDGIWPGIEQVQTEIGSTYAMLFPEPALENAVRNVLNDEADPDDPSTEKHNKGESQEAVKGLGGQVAKLEKDLALAKSNMQAAILRATQWERTSRLQDGEILGLKENNEILQRRIEQLVADLQAAREGRAPPPEGGPGTPPPSPRRRPRTPEIPAEDLAAAKAEDARLFEEIQKISRTIDMTEAKIKVEKNAHNKAAMEKDLAQAEAKRDHLREDYAAAGEHIREIVGQA